jgi:hypothetical protein
MPVMTQKKQQVKKQEMQPIEGIVHEESEDEAQVTHPPMPRSKNPSS